MFEMELKPKVNYLISMSLTCCYWASQFKQIRAFKTLGWHTSVSQAHRGLSVLPAMSLPCVSLWEDNVAALARVQFPHNFTTSPKLYFWKRCLISAVLMAHHKRGNSTELMFVQFIPSNILFPWTPVVTNYHYQYIHLWKRSVSELCQVTCCLHSPRRHSEVNRDFNILVSDRTQ